MFASCARWQVFSVVLKFGVFTQEVDSFLTQSMRGSFGFDPILITVCMVCSVMSALALAAAILAHQLIQAAQQPTIKLQKTKAAPKLNLAEGHIWHMFLSHIWGSGQDQCAIIKRQLYLLLPGVSIFLDVRSRDSSRARTHSAACTTQKVYHLILPCGRWTT